MKLQKGNRRFGFWQAFNASTSLFCLALAPSCSSDEGLPLPAAQFVPDQPVPAAGMVTLQAGTITGGLASLDVLVTLAPGSPGVFSASFDVVYNPVVAFFTGASTADSFMECPPSTDLNVQVAPDQGQAGRLVVGMSRLNNRRCDDISQASCPTGTECDPGVECGDNSCDATTPAPGGDVLITLDFQILGRATTRIDFAKSPSGEEPVLEEF
ncbi:MAG: hypothetical protein O6947_03750, partial [Acidobacteria bacterium]|nr:hypothetical protein [Acidobacteriota bacterium]